MIIVDPQICSRKRTLTLPGLACVVLTAGLLACSARTDESAAPGHHEHALEEEDLGTPTETECRSVKSLDYDTFGAAFLQTYCLACHSTSVSGVARNGAPADHNFDGLEEIRGLADHMDQLAGAGPAATNTLMPPREPRPTVEERHQLSEWLSCGAP